MEKVRLGIIGIGNMGTGHLCNIEMHKRCPEITVTAVADIKPERLQWVKENIGDHVALFDDAEKMMDSGLIDAVLIAVPHYFHPVYAIKAFERGLHVMCEKPAGVYTKQVREMNEAADKHDVVFGMMFNQRTDHIYRKMREIVQSGEMGRIRRTNWIITNWYRPQAYYDSGAWRATWSGEGGGVLLNQCPHNLDLWQWICGMPVLVDSHMHFGKWHDIEVEDDVTTYVEYANGATGCFVTTTGDAPGTNRFEIDLDGGKIVVDNSKTAHVYHYIDKEGNPCTEDYLNEHMNMMEVAMLTSGNGAGSKLYTEETFENNDGWGFQHSTVMQNFAAHILTGSPLLAPGEDGINGVNLANSRQLSAWTGREVSNPCDPEEYAAELNKLIEAEGKFPVRE